MNRRFSGVWHHPDFMKLWIGQTISACGSRISRDGIPLIAVLVLAATPAQMGVLTAIGALPILLFSLPVGVWVDRLRRRPIMLFADLARMTILLSIPFAALTATLHIGWLYVVMALTSLLSLVFDVAYRAVLPTLINREQLVEGNSKLATTDSLAEIGGPALAGVLVQWLTAPLAIVVDAATFLVSAISLLLIRAPEPPPQRIERPALWHDVQAGWRVLADQPALRTLALGSAARYFFGNFIGTLYSLYVIRELGLSPATLGLLIGAGGVGALIGALLSSGLTRRFGLGRTLIGALLGGSLVNLSLPLAGGSPLIAAGLLLFGQLVNDGLMTVYQINEMSLYQTLVPNHLLGRANATIGFLAQGVSPLGALVAGGLASVLGVRLTLLLAVLGILAAALWVVLSPVRELREAPEGLG